MSVENIIFPYDYIIVIIILIIILFSFWKGFVLSVLGLLTWIGSILITIYSYDIFAQFITKQILNITFFQNFEYLTSIASTIVSIPIIFLISLFILKKIKLFFKNDLDKNILGMFLDKIFGIIYGVLFSYALITAVIIILSKNEISGFNYWIMDNSYIINKINNFNNEYIFLFNTINENSDY